MIRVEVRIAAAAATDLQEAAAVDAAAVPGRNPAAPVQRAPLPRQYMHNKENAVTMRLSAH